MRRVSIQEAPSQRHQPTLYSHPEAELDEEDEDEEWGTTSAVPYTPRAHSYTASVSPPTTSTRTRTKLRSANSEPTVPRKSGTRLNGQGYSGIYAQFKRVYRPAEDDDGYNDPDSHYFRRGLGQLVDGGESENEDQDGGTELQYHITLDAEEDEANTPEDKERLGWQAMLASVLDGEVLRSEKNRIGVALDASKLQERKNLHLDIWLGFRAKLRGRSEEEERARIEERRLRTVDLVVEAVKGFRVVDNSDVQAAMLQVHALLRRVDAAQSLYPNLKVLQADKPIWTDPDFLFRIDALNSWINVVTSLRHQIGSLKKWTGSETLDVTEPHTTAEKPLGNRNLRSAAGTSEHADASTFIERVLKEDSLQRTFERGILASVHTLISRARSMVVQYSDLFKELNLPRFDHELVQVISFPTKLLEASLHVRLDSAEKVDDFDVMMIDQVTDEFKVSIGLACMLRSQYEAFMAPDPGAKWRLPPCISDDYDNRVLKALRFFFKLIHWKLKSGAKAVYFKETEVIDAQWTIFNDVSVTIEGGAVLVAEQLCSLINKLIVRVTNYFETQVRVPSLQQSRANKKAKANKANPNSDGEERKPMTQEEINEWFRKILDGVRLRYRKLQRFARVLTQRFSNSAEYSLEHLDIDAFVATLVATDHFLVYTELFEASGTYIIAEPSLRDRPDMIRRMMQRAFHVHKHHVPSYVKAADESGGAMLTADDDEYEDDAAYLLFFHPNDHFVWNGFVLVCGVPKMMDLELKENRVRLLADGPQERLARAKERFLDLFIPEAGSDDSIEYTVGPIPCVVDQQSHLPSVNRELRKIVRATTRLAESIVESVQHVHKALKGAYQSQELLENWFTFAAEHGQQAQKQMDRNSWLKFNRQLTRLAISWVAFICDDCDPTDRRTFRYAVTALEFAKARTRNNYILHLPDDEFSLLRQKVASCITLLVSHFDILGARSSFEAKKDQERLEELKKQQALEAKEKAKERAKADEEAALAGLDDDEPGFANADHLPASERSLRIFHDQWSSALHQVDLRRAEIETEQHLIGRVLDDEKPEDRSLLFLASSKANISMRWQQGRFIGGGAFGSVYLAVNLDSGALMAVKEIRYQDAASGMNNLYKQIKDELSVMEMLKHPNVVEYYGIEVHRDKVYIFEEYCQGGSLAALLELGRIEDEHIIQVYTMQMLEGLAYLHERGVVHRDVKPDNILLDHLGVIKFVDFGAAKILAKNQRSMAQRSRVAPSATPSRIPGMPGPGNSLTGTPMYMSPEVIKGEKRGRLGSMDIWSLGCVVLECATGRKPWSNLDNEWAIMFHIGVATQHPPLPEPGQLSDLGITFIKACLTLDPMKRPTAVELMDHAWMMEFREGLWAYGEDNETDLSTPALTHNSLNSDGFPDGALVARQAAILQEKEISNIKSLSPPVNATIPPTPSSSDLEPLSPR